VRSNCESLSPALEQREYRPCGAKREREAVGR
jgi:hypothetical protein